MQTTFCALTAGAFEKFAKSSWGAKLARRKSKADMTDFDRYKAAVSKSSKSRAVRTAFNKLKKEAK